MSAPPAAPFAPGRWPIEAYGAGGFRFAGMSHRGSILASPAGVRALEARVAADLDAAALATLIEEARAAPGSVDLVLLGTGQGLVPPARALREALRAVGVRCEPMSTAAAARTYNVLMAEDRRVAAALLAVE
ncbi:MAG: hypothetical protein KGI57_04220 [Hyphomicrobiales bacterium]|nr:hypothetical protein [Hyphomicrobiales bacterium]